MSKQGTWSKWEHAEHLKLIWAVFGELNLCASFSSNQSMTSSQAWPSCTPGAWQTLLSASGARGGASWSRYWAAAQGCYGRGGITCTSFKFPANGIAGRFHLHSNTEKQDPGHPKESIKFIRAGQKSNHQPNSSGGLLANARDWQLQIEWSRYVVNITKPVVALELTVPWVETNVSPVCWFSVSSHVSCEILQMFHNSLVIYVLIL